MNINEPSQLKDRILRRIDEQKISMRPKLYFTLQLVSIGIVAAAILLFTIFIFNFLVFSIRINSHDALLGFGPRGLQAFIMFFPWNLLLVDIVLVFVLEWLIRRFRFAYKVPVLYLLGVLCVATVAFGYGIDRGGFNDDALDRADRHELFGPVGEFYEHARRPMPLGGGVSLCRIESISGNTMIVSYGSTTMNVVLPPNSRQATTSGLAVGDVVLIAGDVHDDVLYAYGIHKPKRQGIPMMLR